MEGTSEQGDRTRQVRVPFVVIQPNGIMVFDNITTEQVAHYEAMGATYEDDVLTFVIPPSDEDNDDYNDDGDGDGAVMMDDETNPALAGLENPIQLTPDDKKNLSERLSEVATEKNIATIQRVAIAARERIATRSFTSLQFNPVTEQTPIPDSVVDAPSNVVEWADHPRGIVLKLGDGTLMQNGEVMNMRGVRSRRRSSRRRVRRSRRSSRRRVRRSRRSSRRGRRSSRRGRRSSRKGRRTSRR